MQCAVVGKPVAHSLSPAIHRVAYAHLGLDWSYEAIEIDEGDLPGFVNGLNRDEWRGLSVTMPHKVDAARLGVGDEVVALGGVANTLVFGPDAVASHNTDVSGFEIALADRGIARIERLLLIGNGATARSALIAGSRLGAAEVEIWCRRPERAEDLRTLGGELGVVTCVHAFDALPDEGSVHDLAISTVPAAAGAVHAERIAAASAAVFDVIYDPWPTPLAGAAEARGLTVLNGLDLLAAQALGQIELFTGRSVSLELALTAARDEIAARGRL